MRKSLLLAALVTPMFTLLASATPLPEASGGQRAAGIVDTRPGDNDDRDLSFDYQFSVAGFSTRNHYVSEMPDLQSGDRFSVRMRARGAVYAYMFVTNSDGGLTLVTPSTGEDRNGTLIDSGEWITLPDEDAIMRLDDHRGTEHIYLVVSRRPISDIEMLDNEDVSAAWLRRLRSRSDRGRGDREREDDFVRATYRGTSSIVAFEDVSFRHR